MRKLSLLAPIGLLGLALASGCGKSGSALEPSSGPGSSSADQAAITAETERQSPFVEDGFYASPDQVPLGAATAAGAQGAADAIEPIAFWRHIERVERRLEFAFRDTNEAGQPTTAIVTVHKFLGGTFNILVPDPNAAFERTVIRKPLADHWVRRLLFKLVPEADSRPRWKLAAVSGVKITSRDHTTELLSLRIQGGGRDTTIEHPLDFFRLRNLIQLEAGAEVTLTVTTTRPDDVVLMLSQDHRFRLHANDDNTYTGILRVPDRLGVHHFGVNALARGTLYDDQAPYDSQTWILPYLVRGTELAWGDYAE